MLENIKKELNLASQKKVFHTFIADKLKEKRDNSHTNIIKRKDVKIILCAYNISKKLHQDFLKEMEDYKLIKIKDKQNIEVM